MGYITFDQLKSTVTKLKAYIDSRGRGSDVTVTPKLMSGTNIAEIDVDGEVTQLYAPSGGSGAVSSVNGKTGAVTLTASDVGAKPASYTAPVSSVNNKTGAVVLDATDVGAAASSITRTNTTSTETATSGGTVDMIDSVTTNADGQVTGVNTKTVTLPSGGGGSSTPHPKTKTSSINVVKTRLKDDATLYQPVFLELTCEDGNTYACFAICNAEITATNTMTVYIRQLWGHIFKRVFGQATGTSKELIPLLTATYNTALEQFTVTATLETGSTDWYTVSGTGTIVSQYIKGQYGVRSEEVQFT